METETTELGWAPWDTATTAVGGLRRDGDRRGGSRWQDGGNEYRVLGLR